MVERGEDHVVANLAPVADGHPAVVLEMAAGIDEDIAADRDVAPEIGIEGRKNTQRLRHPVAEKFGKQAAHLVRGVVGRIEAEGNAARLVAHPVHEPVNLLGGEGLSPLHVFLEFFDFHIRIVCLSFSAYAARSFAASQLRSKTERNRGQRYRFARKRTNRYEGFSYRYYRFPAIARGGPTQASRNGAARKSALKLVLRGRESRMAFEITAEEGLVGKIQVIGNLLYAHVGGLEQRLGLENHVIVNPVGDRLAAHPLDERGEVLGRDAELLRIEGDAALRFVVLAQQAHELLEIELTAAAYGGLVNRLCRLVAVEDVAHLVDGRRDQSADDVGAEEGLGPLELMPHLLDEAAQHPALLLRKFDAGLIGIAEKERHHALDVDVDMPHELGSDGYHVGLELVVGVGLDDVLGRIDEHAVLCKPERIKVERNFGLTLRTYPDEEGIDATGIAENAPLRIADGDQAASRKFQLGRRAVHGDEMLKGKTWDFVRAIIRLFHFIFIYTFNIT